MSSVTNASRWTVKPALTRKACTALHDIVNCESASYRRPIRRTIIAGKIRSRPLLLQARQPSQNHDPASIGAQVLVYGQTGRSEAAVTWPTADSAAAFAVRTVF